ncbi:uncharacterized protein LOC121976686 [Zingiber officinale]|uniref:uncharacterized protein LOC121976686 n=1 Tax=Zingiber officinale TaxID=94328 RepID=UPI001C4B3BCF|nr:uncharacterized protein LOC121976686 [Zingiber officinale]
MLLSDLICFRLATCSGSGFGIGVTEEALIIWGDCGGGGDRVVVATGLGDGGDGFVAGPLSQLTVLGDTRCCRIGVLAGAGTAVADFGNSDSEEVVASVRDGVDGLSPVLLSQASATPDFAASESSPASRLLVSGPHSVKASRVGRLCRLWCRL